MYPTPSASAYGSSQNGINGKGGEFERPSAGTPSLWSWARAWRDPRPSFRPEATTTTPGEPSSIDFQNAGQRLNPAFMEWLMGWPIGLTDIGSSATASYRSWLQLHGGLFGEGS